MESDSERQLDLPGFRFHPTEEELIDFYLRKAVQGKRLSFDIIGSLNLYKHEPWDLPGMAKVGEREWYFLVPRDQKPGNGRPNRTTGGGFWKATGSDRPVRSTTDPKRQLGVKKTLVYYQGRAPRGSRTDWVMNEYRLTSSTNAKHKDIVLCKVYRKAIPLKELERRASSEENTKPAATSTSITNLSSSTPGREDPMACITDTVDVQVKEAKLSSTTGLRRGTLEQLKELQVPKQRMEWLLQETCIRSPWMDFWSPYVNLLNLSGEIMNWS